jgi:hypothetical protein
VTKAEAKYLFITAQRMWRKGNFRNMKIYRERDDAVAC